MRIEIHPGEGGDDAAAFTSELASSIGKSFGATVSTAGRVTVVDGPDCL
jgi:hypothetical protein